MVDTASCLPPGALVPGEGDSCEPASKSLSVEERALDGDESAWNILVQQHNSRVTMSIVALGVHPPRARELAQETWALLFQKQRRGALTGLVLPGLALRQARYLALNDLKPRIRKKPKEGRELVLEESEPQPTPEEIVSHREQVRLGLFALESCRPEAREIFLRIYRENESPAGVASALGIPLQYVYTCLSRVRRTLRDAMGEPE